jgi:hypothetical protein
MRQQREGGLFRMTKGNRKANNQRKGERDKQKWWRPGKREQYKTGLREFVLCAAQTKQAHLEVDCT